MTEWLIVNMDSHLLAIDDALMEVWEPFDSGVEIDEDGVPNLVASNVAATARVMTVNS